MKPLPWSHTALEDFVNCPRAFSEKRVFKTVKEEETQAIIWGKIVHKAFEDRQADGVVLPPELAQHEEYMAMIEAMPGQAWTEKKIALNRSMNPCGFFDKDVWFRGVIDYTKVHDGHALVLDYKTGKPHSKFGQLKLFAIHTFLQFPEVETADVKFYWTKTMTTTGERYRREEMGDLWKPFISNLRQYVEAFKTDTWQPRQSGLCAGFCPVKSCEFWRPRRK